jgi:glycosyltransferase involved in cell wall biosynthesis
MLSVLIPVYNFDIRDLVTTLANQALKCKIPYEIVVIDDASADEFKHLNRTIAEISGVKYLEEEINLGRSKIRNRLADLAQYDNLLYLDCDSQIDNDIFVAKYAEHLNENNVVYGGRKYTYMEPSDKRYRLHWFYGIKREQITVDIRNNEPNKSFMTNNFMISREAINKVRFNEKIRGYGHEDTLFGYDLLKCNITITHIDNPVTHIGLEPGEEFLRKTREGIKNLKRIMKINGNEKKLVKDITLLAYYKRFKKFGLDSLVRFLYSKFEYRLRRNLLSKHPNLFLFDLYKLGYLCSLNGDIK